MPYVTVYSDISPFSNDSIHVWYSIDDGLGRLDSVHTYSFQPGYDGHGMVINYESPDRIDNSFTWEITQKQYDQIKAQY